MAHLTGLLIIDAPASALNNAGAEASERAGNRIVVKAIRTRQGAFPYVSAQAFRYWLRSTLERRFPEWQAAPVFREGKIAYTDADPIKYWDDDLFGYMRAPSKRTAAKEAREADTAYQELTPVEGEITRVSPFKVSTLVSLAPVSLVDDFGVMARQDGDPVPHEHQFYRAVLKGLFALDLAAAGTFWHREKTGFRNLDPVREEEARKQGLDPHDGGLAYRLPNEERARRIATLFKALGQLEGGAMQTLHYTDVTPTFLLAAVTAGGNNIFNYSVAADSRGVPFVHKEALREALTTSREELLSGVYVGWKRGFMDDQRESAEALFQELSAGLEVDFYQDHPRAVLERLAKDITENLGWLA